VDETPRPAGGPRRRVGAACVGAALALVVAELAFRAFGLGAPSAPKCLLRDADDPTVQYHCYPSNPSGEFQPAPDVSAGRWTLTQLLSPTVEAPLSALSATPWCVEYRRPNRMVRGDAPAPSAAPGVVRIAGIGDSFALGEGVPVGKTLFAHLQRLMGPRAEVFNCGESGADMELNVRRLDWMVANLAVRRALVVFNLNDVALTPPMREALDGAYDLVNLRAAQLDAARVRPWWSRLSRVAAFFDEAAEVRDVAKATVRSYLDAYDPALNGANLAELSAQFRRLAVRADVDVALVVYPMMYRLDDCPLQPCHDQVVRLAREAGLPVLDLMPAFRGMDADTLRVHALDHHPNGRAHEIAARAVAEWIASEPKLRW
jgi:hypothetical protein